MTIRYGKGARKLIKQKLVVKAQVKSAAAGNPIAQKKVIRQARELEVRDAERVRMAQEQAAQHYETEKSILARSTRVWAEAQALGQEPDQPWPHPDDVILIPEAKIWTVRGPYSPSEVPLFEWIRAQREQNFWSIVEQFKEKGRVTKLCSYYSLSAVKLDQMLPKRWQVGEAMADAIVFCVHFDLRKIRERKRHWLETVNLQRILLGIPAEDKECRQLTDKIMRPLLKPYGYRSLAKFERAWKKDGQKMPWPKTHA